MPVTIGVVPADVKYTAAREMAETLKGLLEAHTGKYEPVDLIESDRLPPGVDYANPNTVYFLILHAGQDVKPDAEVAIGGNMTAAYPDWDVLVVWIRVGPFLANGIVL